MRATLARAMSLLSAPPVLRILLTASIPSLISLRTFSRFRSASVNCGYIARISPILCSAKMESLKSVGLRTISSLLYLRLSFLYPAGIGNLLGNLRWRSSIKSSFGIFGYFLASSSTV